MRKREHHKADQTVFLVSLPSPPAYYNSWATILIGYASSACGLLLLFVDTVLGGGGGGSGREEEEGRLGHQCLMKRNFV